MYNGGMFARLLTQRAVYEGAVLPRWYGVAFQDPLMRASVCYPVPFHLLVRWITNLWYRFVAPPATSVTEDWFRAGYDAGLKAATNTRDMRELSRWRYLSYTSQVTAREEPDNPVGRVLAPLFRDIERSDAKAPPVPW